ncbi:MAG: Two component transcriptional regulator, winged helix family [Candidatus Moranbacteria bacterium GW2011_GWA2_39_41]|nr:MAG: Two component transcriptional regulator, winged helix family [Candidatus Moranbacteria bacterium GW2011_GWA2_39_41]
MDKKTIMIIEDDSFVMDIYQTKLSLEGFDIISANNGMEALKKLESVDCKPDLILLDIIMPLVNGLEVLAKIKKDDRLKIIPVILLTNLSQKEDIDQGLGLGADDFLIKSHFTPSEVLEKIKIYLNSNKE